MPAVAKKKPINDAEPKPTQVPFRVDDPALIEALDEASKELRRSRNMTIIILLEEALAARGKWPPPK